MRQNTVVEMLEKNYKIHLSVNNIVSISELIIDLKYCIHVHCLHFW